MEQEHQDEIADLKRLLEEGQREAASARSQDLDLLKESIERMSHHVASEFPPTKTSLVQRTTSSRRYRILLR